MGGSTDTTQTQTQQTTPWGPAAGVLSGLLGKLGGMNPGLSGTEESALQGLLGNSDFLKQFQGGATGLAQSLLGGGTDRTGMVNDAYAQYQKALNPFASGQYVDPASDPSLQKYLQVARDDASRSVNDLFAGAGRDLSGMHAKAFGEGVSRAEAPILANAFQTARAQQLDAINNLYGAGNTTGGILSALDQTKLANQKSGLDVAQIAQQFSNSPFMAQLQAESMRQGIPMERLLQMFGPALGAGQAFQTTTGTSQQHSDLPWWSSLGAIGSAFGGKK